jgi:hypothetical protein
MLKEGEKKKKSRAWRWARSLEVWHFLDWKLELYDPHQFAPRRSATIEKQ